MVFRLNLVGVAVLVVIHSSPLYTDPHTPKKGVHMQYRTFSKRIDFRPSALGFGLMRLPMLDEKTIDVAESVKIVRYAIDHGVNYLDTAYVYYNGESEKVMAKVLKDGYRQKVKIASKMPMRLLQQESDLDRCFFEQLERLEVDKIDFYLLHALEKEMLPMFGRFSPIKWLEKKRAEGYIDYVGFSFHDRLPVFKKIVDMHDWDFCLLQFNIIDLYSQAGITGLKYAHAKDMGIIIMEALRGGQLTGSVPENIKALWQKMGNKSPVQSMLDFVWDFAEVGCIISGMSSMEQVIQNVDYANTAKIGNLTKAEIKLYKTIRTAYLEKTQINCTNCNYCKVCPQKIAIPYIFERINEVRRYDDVRKPSFQYTFVPPANRANNCTGCNACVAHCPQKLDIPALLQKCSKVFDEKRAFDEVWG